MEALLTPGEAAQLLKVQPRTLQSWRYLKIGPKYTRVGGRVRYRNEDLEAYVKERHEKTMDE